MSALNLENQVEARKTTANIIKDLFSQDDVFTMSIEMIGIHGLTSDYHNHILNMKVTSKPFLIDNREYKVFSNIRGSFAIILKNIFEKENIESIENMFNIKSENFVFNLNEFNDFCKCAGDYKPLISSTDKKFNLYDFSLSNDDLYLINSSFKSFMKKILKQIKSGTNDDLNNFKSQFEVKS